jgi:hypothetical protein
MRRVALIGLVLLGCGFQPEDEEPGYRTGRNSHHDPINGEPGQAGAAGEPTAGELGGASSGQGGAISSPEPPPTSKLAAGVAITEIAVFQGVKVTVAKSGARVSTRTVPVIAGRDGLVRVYVTPEAGYTAKELTAELHLVAGGQGLPIARDTKTISSASSEGTLGSTFNFDVPGSSLPAGVEFFVQILDPAAPTIGY